MKEGYKFKYQCLVAIGFISMICAGIFARFGKHTKSALFFAIAGIMFALSAFEYIEFRLCDYAKKKEVSK